jgi:hypothetical protein
MADPSTGALAVAVAAFGLPSQHGLPADPVTPARFGPLLEECIAQEVLGLLGEAVRAGALVVAPPSRAALEEQLRVHARRDLAVEQSLLRIGAALTGADIEWRVLGPAALARTAYPRPELRNLDRVDVLVDRADSPRAELVAAEVGAAEPPGVVRTLPHARRELFAPAYRFPLGGYELEALPMPQRLLELCSVPLVDAHLVHLRDVAEVVVREHTDLIDVLLLGREWEREAELAATIVTAWDVLALADGPRLVEWARAR